LLRWPREYGRATSPDPATPWIQRAVARCGYLSLRYGGR